MTNQRMPSGEFSQGNRDYRLETGEFLRTAADVGNVSAGAAAGKAIFLRDVARVSDGGEEPAQYVRYSDGHGFYPAVTIAISKRKGTNAVDVAGGVLARVEKLRGTAIPSGVETAITRNYRSEERRVGE